MATSIAAESLGAKLSALARDTFHRVFGERYSAGIRIGGPKQYREKVKQRLDELAKTKSGKQIIDTLNMQGTDGRGVTIEFAEPGDNHCSPTGAWQNAYPKDAAFDPKTGRIDIKTPGSGTSSKVGFNPDYEPRYPDGKSCRSPAVGLGHELLHAIHNGDGENLAQFADDTDPGFPKSHPSNHEEARTIGRGAYSGDQPTDNSLRLEMGFRPRTSHAGVCP